MSIQLISPILFATLAGILAVLVIVYGLWKRHRWSRADAELRDVSRILETTHGSHGHRDLYRSFEHIINALIEFSKRRPAARWVLDDLRPVVAQYHRRAIVASAGSWDEIRNGFLERARHPVRVARAAAGWVVLIGLAGTVLGFMEALPSLQEVLVSQNDQAEVASPPTGQPRTEAAERAALTGQKLHRVLESLQGVFLATFTGVICAFLLSLCNLLLLEPAFDRFANAVDALGARWFEPLIQAPDTLVDDALRGELRSYFDEIGKRLETVLNPLISQLRLSLEQMSGLASDFSSNIRMGVGTLVTFHSAVEKLGGSAQGAVEQLVQIVRTSGDFVREVESLQQKGLEHLAAALSGPTQDLVNSAAAMSSCVQTLSGQISALGEASQAIATAIGQHSQGEIALRQDFAATVDILRDQSQSISKLRTNVDAAAKNLRDELTPLFAALSQALVKVQTESAQENRSAGERMADGIESIRGMLTSLRTLTSPIQDERRAIDELRKVIESLGRQLGQQPASRPKQPPQMETEQQIRGLEAEVRSLRRQVQGGAEGRVPLSTPASIPIQVRREPRGIGRLLRWLSFGRESESPYELLNATHDHDRPMNEKPRSEVAPRNSSPKPEQHVASSQSQSSSVDLQTLDRAVSRLLEQDPGSWETKRLLESLQLSMGGIGSIEIQHLVAPSAGKERLIALWPQSSQAGLAIVSAGQLADDAIIRYFDVAFGQRIIACRQPARVSRSGNEVTVLQKGKVESS